MLIGVALWAAFYLAASPSNHLALGLTGFLLALFMSRASAAVFLNHYPVLALALVDFLLAVFLPSSVRAAFLNHFLDLADATLAAAVCVRSILAAFSSLILLIKAYFLSSLSALAFCAASLSFYKSSAKSLAASFLNQMTPV